jgi:hypothetical protein
MFSNVFIFILFPNGVPPHPISTNFSVEITSAYIAKNRRKGKETYSTFAGTLTGNPLRAFDLEHPYGTKKTP